MRPVANNFSILSRVWKVHFIVRIMGDSFQFQLLLSFNSALDLRQCQRAKRNEKNFSPKSCTFAPLLSLLPCSAPLSLLLSVAKVFLQLRKTLIPGHHPLAEWNQPLHRPRSFSRVCTWRWLCKLCLALLLLLAMLALHLMWLGRVLALVLVLVLVGKGRQSFANLRICAQTTFRWQRETFETTTT